MSGSAQQEDRAEQLSFAATGTEGAQGLKQQVAERLEAHRRRRTDAREPERRLDEQGAIRRTRSGSSKIREAVAARYENSVTYREFLEQEAGRALERAKVEADLAAERVREAAAAQMQLLEELQQWQPSAPDPRDQSFVEPPLSVAGIPVGMSRSEASAVRSVRQNAERSEVFSAGLTVRLYEDLGPQRTPVEGTRRVAAPVEAEPHETSALDDEIAFRRAPEFEPHVEPQAIAGNVIEFPRQLVAARKVRPRLAEGPLRDEEVGEPQMRIFEVEAEQVSTAPVEASETVNAPAWQSMVLESAPSVETAAHVEAQAHYAITPQTARLELRLMAAAVDACCVLAALLGFVTVAGYMAGPTLLVLPKPLLGAGVAGVAAVLFVLFQLLCFSLSDATPGMRYAQIALCTFGDDNPTRKAMRRRVFATLLAACPLGVGLAWAWMDDDGLGWHDRISRMYQRAY